MKTTFKSSPRKKNQKKNRGRLETAQILPTKPCAKRRKAITTITQRAMRSVCVCVFTCVHRSVGQRKLPTTETAESLVQFCSHANTCLFLYFPLPLSCDANHSGGKACSSKCQHLLLLPCLALKNKFIFCVAFVFTSILLC